MKADLQFEEWVVKNRFVFTLTLWLQPARIPQAPIQTNKRGKREGALLGSGRGARLKPPEQGERGW